MATYMLQGTARTMLPRRPVTVNAQVQPPSAGLRVVARGVDGRNPGVLAPQPGTVVLPAVQSDTVIGVEPAGDERVFPPGTTVLLSLTASHGRGSEKEVVVLDPIDVSGLSHRDLVRLVVHGDELMVTAANATVETAVGELSSEARRATRAVLGVDRVDPSSAANVVIGLDRSASMAGALADGSVVAAVEVLVGVALVVADGRKIVTCLVGDGVTWLPPCQPADVASIAVAAMERQGLELGSGLSAPLLRGFAPTQNTIVYLITDGVPGDVAAVAAAGQVDGEVRHLVVLAPADTMQLRGGASGLPVSVLEPAAGGRTGEVLLSSPPVLASLVRSLLVGCFPAGTAAHDRVGS